MLFNSYAFIFIFLPIVTCLFYATSSRVNFNLGLSLLVLSSLVFYGYWNPAYLPLLLGSCLFNFLVGKLLSLRRHLFFVVFGVVANLVLIGYYKYADFFVANLNDIAATDFTMQNIILPLGISFFTFQQITFLIDTYNGDKQRYSFLEYCQFVTFFPQLIAGPIVHHHEMMPQFNKDSIFRNVRLNLAIGLTYFFVGLFKKVVLADSVSVYATPVFQTAEIGVSVTFLEAWIGSLAYTLQLYFDFSGYSDMAIGLARMFGITLPVNFNSPYKACNIIDFWRRWHITLSRFLRDYIYIPLGGNQKSNVRRLNNVFITMLIGGLWHGAGWTFIVWGSLHGLFIVVNQLWISLAGYSHRLQLVRHNRFYIVCAKMLTLLLVTMAWVVFRADSLGSAQSILESMVGLNGVALPSQLAFLSTRLPDITNLMNLSFGNMLANELFEITSAVVWVSLLAGICLFAPNTQSIMRLYSPVIEKTVSDSHVVWHPDRRWAAVVSTVATVSFLHLSGVTEFLYFNF